MLRKEASEFDQHSNFRRLAELRAAVLHALWLIKRRKPRHCHTGLAGFTPAQRSGAPSPPTARLD
jgi:hypothetical protein